MVLRRESGGARATAVSVNAALQVDATLSSMSLRLCAPQLDGSGYRWYITGSGRLH